jgi:hypothetical protein
MSDKSKNNKALFVLAGAAGLLYLFSRDEKESSSTNSNPTDNLLNNAMNTPSNASSQNTGNNSNSTPSIPSTPTPEQLRNGDRYLGSGVDGGRYDAFYDYSDEHGVNYYAMSNGSLYPAGDYGNGLRLRFHNKKIALNHKFATKSVSVLTSSGGYLYPLSYSFPVDSYGVKFEYEIFNPYPFDVKVTNFRFEGFKLFYQKMNMTALYFLDADIYKVYAGSYHKRDYLLWNSLSDIQESFDFMYEIFEAISYNPVGFTIPAKSSVFRSFKQEALDAAGLIKDVAVTGNNNPQKWYPIPTKAVNQQTSNYYSPVTVFSAIPFNSDNAAFECSLRFKIDGLSKEYLFNMGAYGYGEPAIVGYKPWEKLYLGNEWNRLRPEDDLLDNVYARR